MKVTAQNLAQSYISVSMTVASWEASKWAFEHGARVSINVDGYLVDMTRDNEELLRAHFQTRLEVYGRAIEQRGYESIAGVYDVTAHRSAW
jgi:hypothetical protein